MATAARQHYITIEEYQAREREADSKSEYLNRRICAMAGASPEHNQIARHTLANSICS